MKSDDKICYCYNVPLGKLVRFARRTRPARASQLSECLGAGTGCGWCIPILCKIWSAAIQDANAEIDMTPDEYAERRQTYIRTKQPKNTF